MFQTSKYLSASVSLFVLFSAFATQSFGGAGSNLTQTASKAQPQQDPGPAPILDPVELEKAQKREKLWNETYEMLSQHAFNILTREARIERLGKPHSTDLRSLWIREEALRSIWRWTEGRDNVKWAKEMVELYGKSVAKEIVDDANDFLARYDFQLLFDNHNEPLRDVRYLFRLFGHLTDLKKYLAGFPTSKSLESVQSHLPPLLNAESVTSKTYAITGDPGNRSVQLKNYDEFQRAKDNWSITLSAYQLQRYTYLSAKEHATLKKSYKDEELQKAQDSRRAEKEKAEKEANEAIREKATRELNIARLKNALDDAKQKRAEKKADQAFYKSDKTLRKGIQSHLNATRRDLKSLKKELSLSKKEHSKKEKASAKTGRTIEGIRDAKIAELDEDVRYFLRNQKQAASEQESIEDLLREKDWRIAALKILQDSYQEKDLNKAVSAMSPFNPYQVRRILSAMDYIVGPDGDFDIRFPFREDGTKIKAMQDFARSLRTHYSSGRDTFFCPKCGHKFVMNQNQRIETLNGSEYHHCNGRFSWLKSNEQVMHVPDQPCDNGKESIVPTQDIQSILEKISEKIEKDNPKPQQNIGDLFKQYKENMNFQDFKNHTQEDFATKEPPQEIPSSADPQFQYMNFTLTQSQILRVFDAAVTNDDFDVMGRIYSALTKTEPKAIQASESFLKTVQALDLYEKNLQLINAQSTIGKEPSKSLASVSAKRLFERAKEDASKDPNYALFKKELITSFKNQLESSGFHGKRELFLLAAFLNEMPLPDETFKTLGPYFKERRMIATSPKKL